VNILHLIFHLDIYITQILNIYHNYFYLILFLVIFAETGLVVTPFLPGDSLLFIAGSIATLGQLNLALLIIIVIIAAFCGDTCNFFIGKYVGTKLFSNPKSKIFNTKLLYKTHEFYMLYGKKTIIFARFIPLIRTFTPFVAGISRISYKFFLLFSILASSLWVFVFVTSGFLFGQIPFIKHNISLFIMFIVLLSVIPIISFVIKEIIRK
jgi:membrane-associated protein